MFYNLISLILISFDIYEKINILLENKLKKFRKNSFEVSLFSLCLFQLALPMKYASFINACIHVAYLQVLLVCKMPQSCAKCHRVVQNAIELCTREMHKHASCFSPMKPSLDNPGVTGLFLLLCHASGNLYHLIFDLVFVPQISNLFSKLILCHRFSRTNVVMSVFLLVLLNLEHPAGWICAH